MDEEVRAGIEQLEASRRRLVEAAIEQRRALEQELRTGAERRLGEVRDRLRAVDGAPGLDGLGQSVEAAREDLRRFAQGVHPAVLTEHGLRVALEESAALMPFEVTVDVPGERLPASVEVTIYFFCAEALTNAAKHAGATRARVMVRRFEDALEATVSDDGVGGADQAAGTGLRGLADRIAALGGTLAIDSPAGAGTTLNVSVPI
jgi:signal transduction histidine kinase